MTFRARVLPKGAGGVRCEECGASAAADGKGSPIYLRHDPSCGEYRDGRSMQARVARGELARAVSKSTNAKIGDAATTYAAQQSCPTDCVFFDRGGCYAENGRIAASQTIPLNTAAEQAGATALEVAQAEADAIDAMDVVPGRPMRLHTVGDCASDEAAKMVALAAARYMDRGGGPVWTYTHAWRDVARASWGRVSVFASCETAEDVKLAWVRGYAASIVVPEFPGRRKFDVDVDDVSVIPCPAQTTERVTCSSCRLCLNDGAPAVLRQAIGFAVHGTFSVQKAAFKALANPDDPNRRLTSRDHALRLRAEHGVWPTTRELMDAAGVSRESAYEMLKRLREEEAA